MGEITSGISILLGSAVVSTIITTIFNQYNNRKNNTLKYITEERKKWRDTIRLISEKIQACEFSGQDEKNIEKYLVELELNINSCGWGNKKDIKEDAYIWDEINQVKKVDNEGDFKKHKELLIYYISIMLKEDWDRSKNEVNGYSQAFVEILTMILINSAICCLYLHIGQYPPYTWITVVGKVSIYTLMVYGIIKLIIFVADLIRISLGEKFIVHSFLKVLTVELVILIGLFEIRICITKISTFLILCDLAVCLATLYVSFSLVFALMRYLQGKVFLIRFYSPTTLSSSRAEFRLPSRLACA